MSWSLLQFHAVIYPDGEKTLAVPGQLVVYFNGLGKLGHGHEWYSWKWSCGLQSFHMVCRWVSLFCRVCCAHKRERMLRMLLFGGAAGVAFVSLPSWWLVTKKRFFVLLASPRCTICRHKKNATGPPYPRCRSLFFVHQMLGELGGTSGGRVNARDWKKWVQVSWTLVCALWEPVYWEFLSVHISGSKFKMFIKKLGQVKLPTCIQSLSDSIFVFQYVMNPVWKGTVGLRILC